MESIILTISIIISALTPNQLLEEVTFRDLDSAQLHLDRIGDMNLTDSEKAKFLFFQGYVHERRSDIARAIYNYRESIRYYRSLEAKSPGKNSEPLFYYRYHTVHLNLGHLYSLYHNQELAMAHYEEATKFVPENYMPRLKYFMAMSHEKAGEIEKAIDYLLESFKLSVEHEVDEYRIRSQIMLGQLLRDGGKYHESLEYLERVLLEDGLSTSLEVQARNTLGITKWLMKDYRTAELNFNRVLEIGKTSNQFVALENLCEMYLEQGFIYKSIEAGKKAEKQFSDQISDPQNAKLYSYLSDAYVAIDDDARALEYSNKYRDFTVSFYEQQQAVIEAGQANQIKAVTENYEAELKATEDRRKTIQANIVVSSIILITFISLIWQQQSRKKKMVQEIEKVLLS